MIQGNTEGVRKVLINRLEELQKEKINKKSILTEEIVNTIAEITGMINREISVAIDRKGNIISVAIGDNCEVELPSIDVKENKLSGIRIIHTHPSGNSNLSFIDISALIKMRLDCIVAVGVKEGNITDFSLGFCMVQDDSVTYEKLGKYTLNELINFDFLDKVNYIDNSIKEVKISDENEEKAILVGVESIESLDELEELAKACNVKVVEKLLQNRNKIDTTYYVGSGKVNEIALARQAKNADVIIFDDELSGSQVRNLENAIGAKVIDRTTLILEIFASRARSKEAKIQVELAQLKYRTSRLMGLGVVLSRTGGGIGTRGPGEKKLEVDRRHIRERIYDLTKELKKVKKNREIQREKREKTNILKISLVGYTNAGKSTLRNKLCEMYSPKDISKKEKVFEANMLFATLDVTTRTIILPDKRTVAISDTVGFVRKLPHELVEAFKSTLEEVIHADLLLHVVDSSSFEAQEQISAVESVLHELGVREKPVILVLNKIDKASKEQLSKLNEAYKNIKVINISAVKEINLEELLNGIKETLPSRLKSVNCVIPYSEQAIVGYLHRNAIIEEEKYINEGTFMKVSVDNMVYNKIKEHIVD